ncbi:hypothetical protein, partial [Nitrobacter sp.]|uniref:hypothetical protein n=1 Tax=Nitrobacter sp. TaxID=29420 RepID=UPI001D40415C
MIPTRRAAPAQSGNRFSGSCSNNKVSDEPDPTLLNLTLGHRLIKSQPDADCGEFDASEEVVVT